MVIAFGIEGVKDTVVDCVAGTVVALLRRRVSLWHICFEDLQNSGRTHHVVRHDVDHEVHPSCVQSRGQRLEIISCAVVGVELVAAIRSDILNGNCDSLQPYMRCCQ